MPNLQIPALLDQHIDCPPALRNRFEPLIDFPIVGQVNSARVYILITDCFRTQYLLQGRQGFCVTAT